MKIKEDNKIQLRNSVIFYRSIIINIFEKLKPRVKEKYPCIELNINSDMLLSILQTSFYKKEYNKSYRINVDELNKKIYEMKPVIVINTDKTIDSDAITSRINGSFAFECSKILKGINYGKF
ncbi:MAG: hypothetical protein FWF81_08040 [Defluviitaleaceae bacterium]|nr:hypothetical protein [Defluviitaleaceae bacterium]